MEYGAGFDYHNNFISTKYITMCAINYQKIAAPFLAKVCSSNVVIQLHRFGHEQDILKIAENLIPLLHFFKTDFFPPMKI